MRTLFSSAVRCTAFFVMGVSTILCCGCGDKNPPDQPAATTGSDAADTATEQSSEPAAAQTIAPATVQTPAPDPAPQTAPDPTPDVAAPTENPTPGGQPQEPVAKPDPVGSKPPVQKEQVAVAPVDAAAKLNQQLAAFQIPPAWLNDVSPAWSVNRPWSEGRKEIRRLLGLGDDKSRREGIKLTWEYLQKNDIGDGHEYGMYLFLGGEPIWAIRAYREWLARRDHKYPPYFGIVALASLLSERGVYEEAEQVLKRGLGTAPPDPKWKEMRQAEMHDALGDLYTAWGRTNDARTHYGHAIRIYPTGRPPYGRHLLPRRAKKVQAKLDLLSQRSLAGATLRDGTYREKALGYSGDLNLTIKISNGRIADIHVRHQEKIDQNACVLIPQRIVQGQKLDVDGISGATVTKDAIVAGTLRTLRKAGLR